MSNACVCGCVYDKGLTGFPQRPVLRLCPLSITTWPDLSSPDNVLGFTAGLSKRALLHAFILRQCTFKCNGNPWFWQNLKALHWSGKFGTKFLFYFKSVQACFVQEMNSGFKKALRFYTTVHVPWNRNPDLVWRENIFPCQGNLAPSPASILNVQELSSGKRTSSFLVRCEDEHILEHDIQVVSRGKIGHERTQRE